MGDPEKYGFGEALLLSKKGAVGAGVISGDSGKRSESVRLKPLERGGRAPFECST